MSVQALSAVLEESQARLGPRLVLIAIANHANARGENSFPGLETLADEAKMSVRQVIRCVQELEQLGELSVERGTGRSHSNRYIIQLSRLKGAKLSPPKDPASSSVKGDNPGPEMSPEPLRTKSKPSPSGQEQDNGAIPLKAAKGKTLSETLVPWFKTQGIEIPNRYEHPKAAYRALVRGVVKELGTKHRDRIFAPTRIIAEYVEFGTGESFNKAAESHLRGLVTTFGPLPAFDQMHQGIIWGAGINPKYADDPLSLTKYATKILSKETT